MIATVLSGVPLCQACIEKKTGVPSNRIDAVLAAIDTTLKLDVGPSCCHVCLEEKPTTYRLATTDRAARRPQQDGLWRFLDTHRGRMFCTACLAAALGLTRRIDRLVLAAEGRGALRRHERCSVCGKDRLVCGLSSN